ncbi:MAG: sulfotransferase [Planctomycetota bacterium]
MLKGFVVGTSRSGTTLLINLLGSHSRISPLFELEFLLDIIDAYKNKGKIEPREFLGLLYQWGSQKGGLPYDDVWDKSYDRIKPRFGSKYALFTKEALIRAGTDFLDDVQRLPAEEALYRFMDTLSEQHCRCDGKPFTLIKVPSLLRAPDVILAAFPDAKFIHIFRDGRDVWCSAKRFSWGPRSVEMCAHWWTDSMRISDLLKATYPENFVEIKYEDLMEAPQAHLDELFHFLGVPPEPINYEFDRSSINRYKQEMSPEEIDRFNKIAGNYLEKKTYTCLL